MRYFRVEKRDEYYVGTGRTDRGTKELVNKVKGLFHNTTDSTRWYMATCYGCRSYRHIDEFPAAYGDFMSYKVIEPKGKHFNKRISCICIHCLERLVDHFQSEGMDPYKALYAACGLGNLYYDDVMAHRVYEDDIKEFTDGKPIANIVPWVDLYFRKIDELSQVSGNDGKDFWHSDNNQYAAIPVIQGTIKARKDGTLQKTDEMSDEDRENYNAIWAVYHYDPFEDEEKDEKARLMADLVTMIDDAMVGDLVRMRAALEIVRSFHRIDKLSETIASLQLTPELTAQNARAIKELIDTKKKETDMVTAFSKDHGFAEKYAMSKSKGAGTLSAIIRDMKEGHYDRTEVNRYDIETAAAIKQVSDISAESIFKQINFSDSDYAQMVKEQGIKIRELQEQLDSNTEELRLYKEKHLKQDLMEELEYELKEKGLDQENINSILEKEIHKPNEDAT